MKDVFGFENQSKLYNAYRPEYPKPLVDHIIQAVTTTHPPGLSADCKGALDGCVLDIACGTGLFTRQIAPYFSQAVGVDQSDAQLELAITSPDLYQNIIYINHDAYDLKGALEAVEIPIEEVTLISIAQGFHWLDVTKFLEAVVNTFPPKTLFTPIGYSRPHVMTSGIAEDDEFCENICNSSEILDFYEEKFTLYEEKMTDFFEFIRPYFRFDRGMLDSVYKEFPFDEYFENRDLKLFSEIHQTDWFRFQQYVFSTSAYRVCVESNSEAVERGTFEDPLVKLLTFVLETEGKLDSMNSPDFTSPEDAEVLKNLKFDIIWNFFAYVLSN